MSHRTSSAQQNTQNTSQEFPELSYLSEITGEKALQFAKRHNALSDARLKVDARYESTYRDLLKILSAPDKLPVFFIMEGEIFNFWQDDTHVKGILRQTDFASLNSGRPNWATVLDIDRLSQTEKKNWVYKGIHCLEPKRLDRCLVSLSDGGKDAVTLREFDLKAKQFRPTEQGGFFIPESKSHATWLDEDTLLVGDGTQENMLTDSGYPAVIKVLKRGKKLSDSEILFDVGDKAMSAYVFSNLIENTRYTFITNQLSFYEADVYIVDFNNKEINKLPIPRTANFEGVFKERILFSIREPLGEFPAGSLLTFPIADINSWRQNFVPVFMPDKKRFLNSVAVSAKQLFLNVLDDVKNKVLQAEFDGGLWTVKPVKIGNENGNLTVSTSDRESSHVYFHYFDFLTPPSVYHLDMSNKSEAAKILQSPDRFDAKDLVFEQRRATSSDGTQIPYFIIHKKSLKLNGQNPTLLYAYGGFEIPLSPGYSGTVGKAWLEKGGVYVMANLRGGGEYGPDWHSSVLKDKRHKVFEDFYAVTQDLFVKKITSPQKLGIKGGSNGGLLTAVALTQHPEYYRAVISEVPLTNMLEYHRRLAGASWMDEYGNPEEPLMRSYLKSYSPLHNLHKDKTYPEPFFLTSTQDDRVHPAHAREIVARMENLGLKVLYNENTEGGHGRATTMKDMAEFLALEFVYLYQKLFD